MIDNVNDDFINYWYTNTITDCGLVTINNNLNISSENFKEVNELECNYNNIVQKKLKNNYSEQNTKDINENINTRRNKFIDKSNCIYRKKECNINTSNPSIYRNENISNKLFIKKNTNKHNNILQNTNTNNYERKMHSLPQNSQLSEFRTRQRKVLLDTFTRY